ATLERELPLDGAAGRDEGERRIAAVDQDDLAAPLRLRRQVDGPRDRRRAGARARGVKAIGGYEANVLVNERQVCGKEFAVDDGGAGNLRADAGLPRVVAATKNDRRCRDPR